MIIEVKAGETIVSQKEFVEREFNFLDQKRYDGLIVQAIAERQMIFANAVHMLRMHGIPIEEIEKWSDEEFTALILSEWENYNKKK